MHFLEKKFKEIASKYQLHGRSRELFGLLINNSFPSKSPVISKNFKEDSPVRLAFEEFKLSIDGIPEQDTISD